MVIVSTLLCHVVKCGQFPALVTLFSLAVGPVLATRACQTG